MRKTFGIVGLLALTLALGACTQTTTATYKSELKGQNENPPVVTSATGTATATLRADGTLVINGSFKDLSSQLATAVGGGVHLHIGAPGVNGEVVSALSVQAASDLLSGTFSGEVKLDAEQKAALEAGNLYINVHSVTHTSGEIRGQLVKQ
ncbi:CHRD domain-containing protein [Calidithermus chliarophilus]|uniref:CHRD domain-containing protein n=1 Tax=Calidithermus chliarophilus TaxID=52023 RepID=UPI000409357F|nr:CHRD domain-containing protein [Calidithermus chliarophilus]